MNEAISPRSEAELAAIGAFLLGAFHTNQKLEKIMSSLAELTTKLNAALPVLDAIKADVDAMKSTGTAAPAELEAAVTGVTDKVAALRADVPVSSATPPPAGGGGLPGS